MDVKYKKLAKNTFLIFFGGALTKVVSLLMLPFYTRWLTVIDYGITDMLGVYVSLITGIATLCISEAMFIFPKKVNPVERSKYFSSGLSFTIILFGILAIIFWLIQYLLSDDSLNNIFVTYCWSIYALILTSFLQTLTQQFACAIDAMKIYSFTGLIYVISLATISFCIIPQYKVEGYVYSMILANLIASCYTFIFSKSYKYLKFDSIDLRSYKEMISYSLPLIPNSLMWWLVGSFNRPIMESNIGLTSIGLFAIANKFPSVLNMIFQYFSQSWQVSVCEEHGKSSFELFFNKILKSIFLFLIFISALITIFCREILYCTTTEAYYSAFSLIPFLCLGAVFNSISGCIGTVFAVNKKSKYFFYTSLYGAIFSIIMNLLLIPLWGLWGAVVSVVVSFAIITVLRYLYSKRLVHIHDLKFYLLLLILYIFLALFVILFDSLLLNMTALLVFCFSFFLVYRKSVSSIISVIYNRVKH